MLLTFRDSRIISARNKILVPFSTTANLGRYTMIDDKLEHLLEGNRQVAGEAQQPAHKPRLAGRLVTGEQRTIIIRRGKNNENKEEEKEKHKRKDR